MSGILLQNKKALQRFEPWLSQLMSSNAVTHTSTITKQGRLIVHKDNSINLTNFISACQNDVNALMARDKSSEKQLIWIGLISPQLLVDVLKETFRPVILIEKNPGLLHELLSEYDVSQFIEDRRLVIPNPLHFVTTSKNALTEEADVLCCSPFDVLYRDVFNLIKSDASRKSHIDVMMEGELFVDDWYETLITNDIPTFLFNPNWYPLEYIVEQLSSDSVQRIWSINRIKKLPEVLSVLNKPYFIYEIDPDLSDLKPPARHATTTLFCYRKSRTEHYKKSGWNASYLPLATNPGRFQPFHTRHNAYRITFVGTSMWTNAHKLLTALKQSASSEQRKLIESFEQKQRNHPEKYLAGAYADELANLGLQAPKSLTLESILREYSGAAHRSYLLMSIAKSFGVQVWGNEDWELIANKTKGFEYRGKAKHLTEVPAIYAQSKINVDIGRIYQQDIATMRVFDVIAAKKAIVTNYQDGVPAPRLFDESLISYTSAVELLTAIEEILSWTEAQYQEHTERLYQELLEKHTFEHRLYEMLNRSSSDG